MNIKRFAVTDIFGTGRALALLLLASLILSSGLTACGARHANGADTEAAAGDEGDGEAETEAGEGEEKEKAPIPVDVAVVGRGDISSYLSATANLVAEHQVRVLSEAQGRVRQVLVEEGDSVQKGQALAYLVRDDAEIAVEKARVRQGNAERAFERSRDLVGKELISREAYDETTLEFEVARQEVAEAQWQLEKTTIRAPFSGIVSERMVQNGQHVNLSDELFQVTDFDPLVARIFLPEGDVLGLTEGTQVSLELNADPEVAFEGRIRQISPIVDVATGTVKVTVEVAAPPAGVRPGSFVGVHITRETRENTVIVPMDAVIRELQKAYVFVVEGEVAERRSIELGLQEGDLVEVRSGIDSGDRLVTAGQGGLKDGAAVRILETAEAG